jgi:peptide/nickel transport system substrate-binding protein
LQQQQKPDRDDIAMNRDIFAKLGGLAAALTLALSTTTALADPQHGIAMYGDPALPPDFVSLPHVNPDAPKGGSLTLSMNGGFDTLNPFITNGSPAEGISALTIETLMARSYDEPFSLYGLLAESIETDEGRTFVEFTLREAARFSDGSPVTVEDVLWSFETLGTLGSPRYHGAWEKIAKAEARCALPSTSRTVNFR